MKKTHVIALLGVPLFLVLAFGVNALIGMVGAQEEPAPLPPYHFETDHTSMADVGKLLERLGKEIQQNNSISVGGNIYPVKDQGSLEFSVTQRQSGRTGIQIEIGSGRTETPTQKKTYTSFARFTRQGTTADFAKLVISLGETLTNKGIFFIEDHEIALEGPAKIVQRLSKMTRQMGNQRPYTFTIDVLLGEKDFPLPEDEEDEVEAVKLGIITELAKKETAGADQKVIAELYSSLRKDLEAGKMKVGEETYELGENIGFGISHLIAKDGESQRIRVGLMFGKFPPRKKPSGPRYSEEFFDAPMKKVGALLKRLGSEILETESFKLGEDEFKVKPMVFYEVNANERGFSLELRYLEPPKEEK